MAGRSGTSAPNVDVVVKPVTKTTAVTTQAALTAGLHVRGCIMSTSECGARQRFTELGYGGYLTEAGRPGGRDYGGVGTMLVKCGEINRGYVNRSGKKRGVGEAAKGRQTTLSSCLHAAHIQQQRQRDISTLDQSCPRRVEGLPTARKTRARASLLPGSIGSRSSRSKRDCKDSRGVGGAAERGEAAELTARAAERGRRWRHP